MAEIASAADALLRSEAETGRFRGVVLLARHGEVLLREGYGFANEEWRIPNTASTKFRIGSVTKMLTAAAVLRLVEGGVLGLDEPIDTWVEALPDAWRKLIPHQLLSHTSGLRDHIAVPAKRTLNLTGAKPAELVGLIAGDPLLFEPGTRWSYSNTGYILLGMLIEKASNRNYARFIEEELLRPAGMTATGYDSFTRILSERASGYGRRDGELVNADYLDMSVPFSAGALYSTVDDLQRWNTALHGGCVLSGALYKRMVTPCAEGQKDDWGYGYGVFVSMQSGHRCLAHDGGVNGFLAVLHYYPEMQASLIVLANILDPLAMRGLVERVSRLLLG
jgi:CubicO group peptidase (beta-lactamase class C family)